MTDLPWLTITTSEIEALRCRSLHIAEEIKQVEAKRQQPLPIDGLVAPTEVDDQAIRKIRKLRVELKGVEDKLLMASYCNGV